MNPRVGGNVDERPRVHVVWSNDTLTAYEDVVDKLDRLGVDATSPAPVGLGQVRAVVVMISADALRDPLWQKSVESLRGERLVPVRVGDLIDDAVPNYLRELNWLFYRARDSAFVAQLFTGINTDASRFRDIRDTRALAERWDAADRSPDLLIDSVKEVRRRIRSVVAAAEVTDPFFPLGQVIEFFGSFRERYRYIVDEGGEMKGTATTPIEFLALSRKHARKNRHRRLRKTAFRSAVAAVTIAVIVVSVGIIDQAKKKNINSVAFTVADLSTSARPDLAAIKAGASLVDSGTYSGDDGRLRIAVIALSQHWQAGYLSSGNAYALGAGAFLADGSIDAPDYGGLLWTWDATMKSRTSISEGAGAAKYFDVDPTGAIRAYSDGSSLLIARSGVEPVSVTGVAGITDVRIAPANGRLLVAAGGALWAIDGIDSVPSSPRELGTWDRILDMTQTEDGRAVALAEADGKLYLVADDGSSTEVGEAPAAVDEAAIAHNGKFIALAASGALWISQGNAIVPTGIPVTGVALAMDVTDGGLIVISDRTRGVWVADAALGISLGDLCTGMPSTWKLSVDNQGERVLCNAGSIIEVDSIAELRPSAVGVDVSAPTQIVASTGEVKSLAIVDGFIRFDRSDGTSFVFDAASLSLTKGFETPEGIADADYLATGSHINADHVPTAVAVTADGGTFAVGFVDGSVVEVDVDDQGHLAPVGSWQLPDHSPVTTLSWSADHLVLTITTESGLMWERASCAGCWGGGTLYKRIEQRAWLCYDAADIESLGDTAKNAFRLHGCASLWDSPR